MVNIDYKKKKKIIVIGCPGSGKSYFSKKLSAITKLPLYHLDLLYWRPNWQTTPADEFREKVIKVIEEPKWIIDGNYNSTLELRFLVADLVFFLDLPTENCLENVRNRIGKDRDDFPKFLKETGDQEFFEYIRNFKDNGRVAILEMMEKYPKVPVVILKNRGEINDYLRRLTDKFN